MSRDNILAGSGYAAFAAAADTDATSTSTRLTGRRPHSLNRGKPLTRCVGGKIALVKTQIVPF